MIVKESEAYKFMCPVITTPEKLAYCVGKKCMAWKDYVPYNPVAVTLKQEMDCGCCAYMKNK